MPQTPNSFPWTTEKIPAQVYRNSWDFRFRTHDPRAAITHLTPEEYRALYLEVFKVTAPAQPRRILDYGCGTGLLLPFVKEKWRVTGPCDYFGADISPEMISYCRTKFPNEAFFLVPDNASVMEDFSPYDFIVCHSVLTHITLEDGKELLRTLHGLLAPGGRASISVVHDPEVGTIGGDWGKVTYGRPFFQVMLANAGFAFAGEQHWVYSPEIGQTFYALKKGEKHA